jgi:hypothetical protein
MRISGILIGLWITVLFVAGYSIAPESFVPKLEPVPTPGIAGALLRLRSLSQSPRSSLPAPPTAKGV